MNRATSALDRVVVGVIALALLVGGAWTVAWSQGWLPDTWWSPRGFFVGPLPSGLLEFLNGVPRRTYFRVAGNH